MEEESLVLKESLETSEMPKGGDKAQEAKEETKEEDDEHTKANKDEFGPYKSELTYLEDQITLMRKESNLAKLKTISRRPQARRGLTLWNNKVLSRMIGILRIRLHAQENLPVNYWKKAERLERIVKQFREKIRTKIAVSRCETGRDFRLEQQCAALSSEKFEMYCLLKMLKSVIVPSLGVGDPYGRSRKTRSSEVCHLIESFCSTLEERMKSRRFFYKTSMLIRRVF